MNSVDDIGKMFMVAGCFLILIGVSIVIFKISWFGRLPGDYIKKGEHYTVYIPIVSCLLLSIIFTLIYKIFSRN